MIEKTILQWHYEDEVPPQLDRKYCLICYEKGIEGEEERIISKAWYSELHGAFLVDHVYVNLNGDLEKDTILFSVAEIIAWCRWPDAPPLHYK